MNATDADLGAIVRTVKRLHGEVSEHGPRHAHVGEALDALAVACPLTQTFARQWKGAPLYLQRMLITGAVSVGIDHITP